MALTLLCEWTAAEAATDAVVSFEAGKWPERAIHLRERGEIGQGGSTSIFSLNPRSVGPFGWLRERAGGYCME